MTRKTTIVSVTTKTYVKQFSPSNLASDSASSPVDHRDPERYVNEQLPSDVYCFQFYDVDEVVVIIRGRQTTTRGAGYNESNRYFPHAKLLTLGEATQMLGDDSPLVMKMLEQKRDQAIIDRFDQGHIRNDHDEVLG